MFTSTFLDELKVSKQGDVNGARILLKIDQVRKKVSWHCNEIEKELGELKEYVASSIEEPLEVQVVKDLSQKTGKIL